MPGLLAARLRGVPFVFEVRDLWPDVPIAIGAAALAALVIAAQSGSSACSTVAPTHRRASEASRDALPPGRAPATSSSSCPTPATSTSSARQRRPRISARHGLEGKFVALYSRRDGRAPTARPARRRGRRCARAGATTSRSSPIGDGGRTAAPRGARPRARPRQRPVPAADAQGAPRRRGGRGRRRARRCCAAPGLRDQLAEQVLRLAGRRQAGDRQPRRLAAASGRATTRAGALRAGRRRRGARRGTRGARRRARARAPHGRATPAAWPSASSTATWWPTRLCADARARRRPHAALPADASPTPTASTSAAASASLDLAVAGVGTVVAAPLLAGLAATVYATSGRPVLFVQDRVGNDGVLFGMYKFRSMIPDAVEHGAGLYVEEDDEPHHLGRPLDARLQPRRAAPAPERPEGRHEHRRAAAQRRVRRRPAPRPLRAHPQGQAGADLPGGRQRPQPAAALARCSTGTSATSRRLGLRTDLGIILRTIPTVLLRRGSTNDVPREFIEDISAAATG